MLNFQDKLRAVWEKNNSLLCVGLDPDITRFPSALEKRAESIFDFNKMIIDATHDLVCAYKPQIAYFAAYGAEEALARTIEYIHENYPQVPVILDAKRGDIGSTAQKYGEEAFVRYQADAVTVNPYLGYDSVAPFLEYKDKGVVLLCRTSNKGAADIQDLEIDGTPLYEKVAEMISSKWNSNNNCIIVVGATWPEQMSRLRALVGDMPFLVPGVGAQGGDVEKLVTAGKTTAGTGLLVSASRSIIYAGSGDSFADDARSAALDLRDLINKYR
ncbi:MAG: orotidine-5'-phosphate decarboxylase [Desulfobulbaceae bacterium]|nr:orotidine-5'-phosphate decarboxylase [Desulfobulbaceae bacterium]